MPFEIPARIQSRLDRKASPVVPAGVASDTAFQIAKSKQGTNYQGEIIPIAEWAEYRAAHPDLVFTGRFDLQGRPIWAAEERTR